MGCTNGKEILSEEDKNYIAQNTAISRDEIDVHHVNFLQKHPDGRISRFVERKFNLFKHILKVHCTAPSQ